MKISGLLAVMLAAGFILAGTSGCLEGKETSVPNGTEIGDIQDANISADGENNAMITITESGANGSASYVNDMNDALPAVFSISADGTQAIGEVCLAVAFTSINRSVPLMFDDGYDQNDAGLNFEKRSMADFGSNGRAISAAIAKEYWAKAEIVFSVNTYEESLWCAPAASLLSAPILMDPSADTLSALGAKLAICIGSAAAPEGIDTKTLGAMKEVWKFQMDISGKVGKAVNYMVVTNPADIKDEQYIGLSAASAMLACYHNAIVLTGNYAGNKSVIQGYSDAGGESNPEFGDEAVSYGLKVEKSIKDSIAAIGMAPKYMALVGGPFALPSYYVQVDGLVFSSLVPYFCAEVYEEAGYVEETVAGARIVGDCILDVTYQLMRTFSYVDFLPNGKYYSSTPSGWETNSLVLDAADPTVGTTEDAVEMTLVFMQSGFNNEHSSLGFGVGGAIKDTIQNRDMVYASCHGDIDGWYTKVTPILTAEEVRGIRLSPSVVWSYCCLSSALDGRINPKGYDSLAFVHAGALAYISHTEVSDGYFPVVADVVPGMKAGACLAAKYAFQSMISSDAPMGDAMIAAKAQAQSEAPSDKDMLSMVLYGDPAWNPYAP